jgi:hypothetical protein
MALRSRRAVEAVPYVCRLTGKEANGYDEAVQWLLGSRNRCAERCLAEQTFNASVDTLWNAIIEIDQMRQYTARQLGRREASAACRRG